MEGDVVAQRTSGQDGNFSNRNDSGGGTLDFSIDRAARGRITRCDPDRSAVLASIEKPNDERKSPTLSHSGVRAPR
jgi:hypothetical protein